MCYEKKLSILSLSSAGSSNLGYVKIFSPILKLFETEHENSSSVNAERRLLCKVSITNRLEIVSLNTR